MSQLKEDKLKFLFAKYSKESLKFNFEKSCKFISKYRKRYLCIYIRITANANYDTRINTFLIQCLIFLT